MLCEEQTDRLTQTRTHRHTQTHRNPFTCSLTGNVSHLVISMSAMSYHQRTESHHTSFLMMQCYFRIRRDTVCMNMTLYFHSLTQMWAHNMILNSAIIYTIVAIRLLCEVVSPWCSGEAYFSSLFTFQLIGCSSCQKSLGDGPGEPSESRAGISCKLEQKSFSILDPGIWEI